MKMSILLTSLLFSSFCLLSQNEINYNSENYSFHGYSGDCIIYQFYPSSENISGGIKNNLYYPVFDDNMIITGFNLINESDLNSVFQINDEINLCVENNSLIIFNNEIKDTILDSCLIKNEFALSADEEILVFPVKINFVSTLASYNIKTGKFNLLPIYGKRPYFNSEYLYFSSDHICENYSVYTEDVFRVKISEWSNPEIVLEDVETDSWLLHPETNIIYADIIEEKGKGAIYHSDLKAYSIVDEIHCDHTVLLDGRYYYEIRQNNEPIKLKRMILPKEYVYEDKRELCEEGKRTYMNLADSLKQFRGTFISDEILNSLSQQQLRRYSKDQLRILRNAFYARQGYVFKDEGLKIFFMQFQWYKQLRKRNTLLEIESEDIILTPFQKERIRIIREIENSFGG